MTARRAQGMPRFGRDTIGARDAFHDTMARATFEEIAELLGDDIDEGIVERVVTVGASLDEVGEAIDDVEYAQRYGEPREASSARVDEVRAILEEIAVPPDSRVNSDNNDEEEDEGLTIIEPEDLGTEQ
jgi:hypothetical protein